VEPPAVLSRRLPMRGDWAEGEPGYAAGGGDGLELEDIMGSMPPAAPLDGDGESVAIRGERGEMLASSDTSVHEVHL